MPDGAAPCGAAGSSGWWEGASHVFPTRVYYEDTDAGGIVYHASYLRFAERARNEMLRLSGFPHAAMVAETGVALAVRHCEIDYRQPARLDDALEVVTRIVDIGAATLEIEQDVRRTAGLAWGGVGAVTGVDPLVRLALRLACINAQGRPVRLPAALRSVLVNVQPGALRPARVNNLSKGQD
ncbi:acyl-CoA thioester hydrolase [Niveispirillum lacus]|uniref:Acyl-CoA thioester hydrolase n=2 Tax=Niveispirillum lacus TaxID=1981099 RepID=A0A255YUM3_9PROT|nr:acyl-CoA thioester hydrolase [Niveispirillum lacus]